MASSLVFDRAQPDDRRRGRAASTSPATLDDDAIAAVRAGLLEHKVLFFRDQDITTEQHLAFGRRFGDLEIHPVTPKDQEHPEVS